MKLAQFAKPGLPTLPIESISTAVAGIENHANGTENDLEIERKITLTSIMNVQAYSLLIA
jgi:hypothetical protein